MRQENVGRNVYKLIDVLRLRFTLYVLRILKGVLTMADKQQEQNEQVGRLAGLGAGVIAGASLGTVLLPIPVVGTFAGALVGGVLGSEVGKTVGSALLDGIHTIAENLSGTPTPAQKPDSDKDTPAS
jgi:phage tail tape-measure protein